MKKSRLTKLMTAVFLAGVMAVCFCGCGEAGVAEEPAETETAVAETEEAAEPTTEYDFMTVLNENGFEEEFSTDVMYFVEQDSETCVSVYLRAPYENGDGGLAGSIMVFEKGNTDYEQFPDYEVIGQKDGMTFVTCYATDVQYGENADEETIAAYDALVQKLKTFRVE